MPRTPLHVGICVIALIPAFLVQAQITCSPGQGPSLSNPPLGSSLPEETTCNYANQYRLRLSTASGYSAPIFDTNFEVDGRLEICYNDEWWSFWVGSDFWTGTDYPFTDDDAQVACRQLGNQYDYEMTTSSVLSTADTPDGNTNYGPYDLQCEGDEATVAEVRSSIQHRPVDAVPNS